MENSVVEFIPYGKSSAVSISDLKDLTNLKNRAIRIAIEKEREKENDFVIISSSKFKGYYKSKDKAEIQAYILEQTKRAKKILWNLKTAKKFLGEKDQIKIIWE